MSLLRLPPATIPSKTLTPSRRAPRRPSSTATTGGTASRPPSRAAPSPLESRVSLVFALVSQASSVSQRLLFEVASETTKYVFPKRFEARNFEEALMSVPDLETIKYEVVSRRDEYEIREVERYYVAETTMPGKTGFDFYGASQSFNVLAEYLFGKNTKNETTEMEKPILTRKVESDGEKMEMTTPVITKKVNNEGSWQMSFVMPSKYGAALPLPKDPSVRIKQVPGKVVAVVAFSGFVTDEEVKQRELKLRSALGKDTLFKMKEGAVVEVAQYPPQGSKTGLSSQLAGMIMEEGQDSTGYHHGAWWQEGDTGWPGVNHSLHSPRNLIIFS